MSKNKIFIKASTYKGLHGFHKYWGKKPFEINDLLISKLTSKNDIVLDPFLGGGLITRTAVINQRKFIGIDINPISCELANLFLKLPSSKTFEKEFDNLKNKIKQKINKSYLYEKKISTHFLWFNNELKEVWSKNKKIEKIKLNKRVYLKDINFFNYNSKNIRDLKLFNNSRINSKNSMNLRDFFTGRALRNIDLILDEIKKIKDPILKRSLLLCLTSASGQMSKMVFSISKRSNKKIEKEVGSWAIGLWRPKEHFEINVWNCFENRTRKFIKTLKELGKEKKFRITDKLKSFYKDDFNACIKVGSNLDILKNIPNNSISLIITDPPHGDRIPYLELSEIWNSILKLGVPNFNKEIVVSNASDRNKDLTKYNYDMKEFFKLSMKILKKDGVLILFFNALKKESWDSIRKINKMKFEGYFPMNYSANSIVQDNRKGAMKSDYVLFFSKDKNTKLKQLEKIAGFKKQLPKFLDD